MNGDGQDAGFAGSVQFFLSSLTKIVDPHCENEHHDEEMERQYMNVVSLFFHP
jgi:hypothetical protein